jgi:hypothetical protein
MAIAALFLRRDGARHPNVEDSRAAEGLENDCTRIPRSA